MGGRRLIFGHRRWLLVNRVVLDKRTLPWLWLLCGAKMGLVGGVQRGGCPSQDTTRVTTDASARWSGRS